MTASPRAATPLGILLHGTTPVHEIAPLARRIEEAGFSSLWFGEDYFFAGGFCSAAIALQATTRLQVGLGVVATVARHPAVLAMEAGTLAGAFPGRFTIGVGHGVPAWMRQMRLYPKSPLTAMRECLSSVRQLLDGKNLSFEGEYFGFREIALHHPAPSLPILAGVVGPKSVRVALEQADGLIVSALAGPQYVSHARQAVLEAAQAAGRDLDPQLPVFAFGCINEDGAKARATLRQICAFYLAAMGPTDLTGVYGVNDRLKAMIEQGGSELIAQQMPDEWLEWLGISGTPADCLRQINALLEAGATSVALAITPHESFDEQLAVFSREVLPHFR